jgi:hypothetical protein
MTNETRILKTQAKIYLVKIGNMWRVYKIKPGYRLGQALTEEEAKALPLKKIEKKDIEY